MNAVDLHTHTFLCRHAEGTMEEYLETARERKLKVFGFSDHAPWPEGFDAQWRMRKEEFPLYLETIRSLRKTAEKAGITLLSGLEFEWTPDMRDCWKTIPEVQKLDYTIASIHFAGNFAFDDPAQIGRWKEPGMPEFVWKEYLRQMKEMVSCGTFEIIGHADLPKKFGFFPEKDESWKNAWEEIFTLAAERGTVLELNTNGLLREAKEIYPSGDLLQIAYRCGVAVTFGSDAHKPGDVGRNLEAAMEAARKAGYRNSVFFREHEKRILPFD